MQDIDIYNKKGTHFKIKIFDYFLKNACFITLMLRRKLNPTKNNDLASLFKLLVLNSFKSSREILRLSRNKAIFCFCLEDKVLCF